MLCYVISYDIVLVAAVALLRRGDLPGLLVPAAPCKNMLYHRLYYIILYHIISYHIISYYIVLGHIMLGYSV